MKIGPKQLKKKKNIYTKSTSSSANLISVIYAPQVLHLSLSASFLIHDFLWAYKFLKFRGLKLPILKRLYYLLINLSWFEAELNYNNICNLVDVLFKETDGRFKEFLCGRALTSIQELTLLLRCCMVFLNLLVSRQSLLIEKGRLLLSILHTLISAELNEKTENNSFTHVASTCVLLQVLNIAVQTTFLFTEKFIKKVICSSH